MKGQPAKAALLHLQCICCSESTPMAGLMQFANNRNGSNESNHHSWLFMANITGSQKVWLRLLCKFRQIVKITAVRCSETGTLPLSSQQALIVCCCSPPPPPLPHTQSRQVSAFAQVTQSKAALHRLSVSLFLLSLTVEGEACRVSHALCLGWP